MHKRFGVMWCDGMLQGSGRCEQLTYFSLPSSHPNLAQDFCLSPSTPTHESPRAVGYAHTSPSLGNSRASLFNDESWGRRKTKINTNNHSRFVVRLRQKLTFSHAMWLHQHRVPSNRPPSWPWWCCCCCCVLDWMGWMVIVGFVSFGPSWPANRGKGTWANRRPVGCSWRFCHTGSMARQLAPLTRGPVRN